MKKIGRWLLLGFGISLVISAVLNIVGALKLIEPSDAESLGITRNEIIGMYLFPLVGGLVLIWLGARRPK
ncbi:MAG TPA: hypothetical protein VHO24_10835 [Opitutaceae bacterium]|nr:hypothetical protein [Opitutaceae bacterium]